MYHIELSHPVHVHFVGIGGISMSALAELLNHYGFTVTGSDWKSSPITRHLEELGINIAYGPNCSAHISPDTAVIIYTAACRQDSPELLRAAELGIPCIDRGSLMGDVNLGYKANYAVAGSHGKTTGTSMLASVMLGAGLDPTVLVGGVLGSIGSNIHIGSTDRMVLEACEYTDSFLRFHPTHAIITNIEPEHLDYFKTIERERASYRQFASLLPADGLLVACRRIPSYDELFEGISCPLITYDISTPGDPSGSTADYFAADIEFNETGCGSFTLIRRNEKLGRIALSVVGEHNILNATGVAAMCLESGIAFDAIAAGLAEYRGTARRFEKKGEIGGVTIIDDYAHHPTEIRATVSAAFRYPHKRLFVVFQPHTYSRTITFLNEISEALSPVDTIILTDIYAARETNTCGVSSKDIVRVLHDDFGKDSYYFSSFDEIENFLLQNCCTGDLLITMGAGDVVLIGDRLLGR